MATLDVDILVMPVQGSGLDALSPGRTKDHLRILSMLEAGSLRVETIEALAARHGLSDRWSAFKRRYLDE